MYVFSAPELKITLSRNSQYAAAKSTAAGAPFRSLTVRDTIGDLPAVGNGATTTNIEVTNFLFTVSIHYLKLRVCVCNAKEKGERKKLHLSFI